MIARFFRFLCIVVAVVATVHGAPADEPVRRTWTIDGVTREALVYLPPHVAQGGAPLVFVFHGHGGTMGHAARTMAIHQQWPEAIVIYPQGLPTPGAITDPQGREPGWQSNVGKQGDRDLKFFDAVLADLIHLYHPDEKRIYSTGHSNGGAFTYLLWAERGDKFAAMAPSAAVLGRGVQKLKPKPVLHLGSPSDPLVKFSWQEQMIDHLLKLNGCPPRKPAATGYTLYPSPAGNDVALYLHDGGHKYPDAAPELIVKFFKAHPGH
ncbi:MAG TPA: prolyl oligopeptidase family serine peptidase [Candidatus Didemnitutus sp.]|nr:prolyl oligopeptidase family serine peptidase [Candidatus Didemnitutus sp.]